MTRTTKTPPAPAEDVSNDQPTHTFEPLKWTPNDLPRGATVTASELCQLVEHVLDVSSGAATVFKLIEAYEGEIDSDIPPYLNPYHLGRLRSLATRSLESLDCKAGEIATRLHQMARGEA